MPVERVVEKVVHPPSPRRSSSDPVTLRVHRGSSLSRRSPSPSRRRLAAPARPPPLARPRSPDRRRRVCLREAAKADAVRDGKGVGGGRSPSPTCRWRVEPRGRAGRRAGGRAGFYRPPPGPAVSESDRPGSVHLSGLRRRRRRRRLRLRRRLWRLLAGRDGGPAGLVAPLRSQSPRHLRRVLADGGPAGP